MTALQLPRHANPRGDLFLVRNGSNAASAYSPGGYKYKALHRSPSDSYTSLPSDTHYVYCHTIMSSAATKKNNETIEVARTLAHAPLCEEYERMISGML